jgi:hypothetical protein
MLRISTCLLLLASILAAQESTTQASSPVTIAQRLEIAKLYVRAVIAQVNADRAKAALAAKAEEAKRICVASGGEFDLLDDGDARCEPKPKLPENHDPTQGR